MIRNYILIAIRLLIKNKVFSAINVLGLSTGIACCVLITLFIQDEFKYEKGFEEGEKIFRINTRWIKDGNDEASGRTSPPIAMELAENLPEVVTATRVAQHMGVEQHIVRYKEKTFFEKNVFLVDSTFLDVFSYRLLEGNSATALDGPSSVLISHDLSKKIFGAVNPVDELLIINSGTSADTFRVTGVVEPPEFPSHVDADIYMSLNSKGFGRWVLSQTTWANNNMIGGYLKLHDPLSGPTVEIKMNEMLEMRAGEELRQSGRKKLLSLQALNKIRLYSGSAGSLGNEQSFGGSITYVYMIGTIGVFILVLACINFMNLTTARSAQRAGEVGIRKSMGAYRKNLIGQFLGESMVIVLISVLLAFAVVVLSLPLFNMIMQKQLALTARNLPFIISATMLIALTTGILAGSYPAFFLSGLKPTQVLKGKTLSGDGSQWLRKGLVVFQFVITITLVSAIVIIQKQLRYVQSKALGFDSDQVIMVPLRSQAASSQYVTLKTSFQNIKGVNAVSATTSLPSTPLFRDWLIYKKGWSNDQSLRHEIVNVDENYFEMLEVPLLTGRDFVVGQDNIAADSVSTTKVMVNEASLNALDIRLDEAVGHDLIFEVGTNRYDFTIIGVVKDFHQFSLHREIGPMLFILPSNRTSFPYLAVSVSMPSYQESYEQMKAVWNAQVDDIPFETVFLTESIRSMYKSEQRISSLLTISTVIAGLISCLGLYGLSVYVAERKTKEIGIRKVVGASVQSIVTMLSKEYIQLILISFLISVPLGYYAMNKWLEGFAYKISPGVTVFLVSGAISFVIAWLTVSFESFRAARKNPVQTLRS